MAPSTACLKYCSRRKRRIVRDDQAERAKRDEAVLHELSPSLSSVINEAFAAICAQAIWLINCGLPRILRTRSEALVIPGSPLDFTDAVCSGWASPGWTGRKVRSYRDSDLTAALR